MEFTQLDKRPEILVESKVVLPREVTMTRMGLNGNVILSLLVNEKGGVADVKVLRAFSPANTAVDDACVQAKRQNRYRPAMKDGKKVKTWISVTMQINVQPAR